MSFVRVVLKTELWATKVVFSRCTCDFPEPDTKVQISVDLKNLTIIKCDEEWTALDEDEEDARTPFPWSVITRGAEVDEDGALALTYSTDDGDEESITISSPHHGYLHSAIGGSIANALLVSIFCSA
jgi:hypothetical protein